MSQIGPGDVLVGISFPRYSQMAIHAVEYARDRGADVVAITDSQMSPLYRMATVSLLVRSDMISFVDSMAERADRGSGTAEERGGIRHVLPAGERLVQI